MLYLFLCTVNLNVTFLFVEKIHRFVGTEFVKLSDVAKKQGQVVYDLTLKRSWNEKKSSHSTYQISA